MSVDERRGNVSLGGDVGVGKVVSGAHQRGELGDTYDQVRRGLQRATRWESRHQSRNANDPQSVKIPTSKDSTNCPYRGRPCHPRRPVPRRHPASKGTRTHTQSRPPKADLVFLACWLASLGVDRAMDTFHWLT